SMPERASRAQQRGVASLMVVMVLFFIVSLVAAYTSRNLIFEQRTSANQYRSTQAFEAAEAGIEWAIAQVNGGRITASCLSTGAVDTDTSFRQRYLDIAPNNGQVTPKLRSNGSGLWPSCVFNGTDWVCHCPADAAPALSAPTGAGVFPAFRVRFAAVTGARSGVIRIESNGCTRLDNGCLDFPAQAAAGEGRATVTALVALKAAVTTPPAAALTARGDVNLAGAGLAAYNTDPTGTGITVQSGAGVTWGGLTRGTPGTPDDLSVVRSDSALLALSAPRMFASVFGVWPASYRDQPAAVQLNCPIGGCSAVTVRDAVTMNPGRAIWLQGDLQLDSAGDIGSAAAPVTLVVTGNVAFVANGVRLFGLLYSQGANWTGGGAEIRGAAVVENGLAGSAVPVLVYDAAILNLLRLGQGSFVRVPGGWRDFP
ncbi:MAG: pilus assembly PilX N-terminal domain-containing protein, partial [Rubrivivax sp.]|nr:pilus assembly PilX N-terminal domain-containing protein [Rubrivivax sp.]